MPGNLNTSQNKLSTSDITPSFIKMPFTSHPNDPVPNVSLESEESNQYESIYQEGEIDMSEEVKTQL